MDTYSKASFQEKDDASRATLCSELAKRLGDRLAKEGDFHGGVLKLINELRGLGHDLWSFDESDEMEVWCANYQTSTGPGIVVTFRLDGVSVEWSAEG